MRDRLDSILTYAVRLDGLSGRLLRDLSRDVAAAINQVETDLRRRVRADAPVTFDRLQSIRGELAALREALRLRLRDRVDEALDAILETAPRAAANALSGIRASAGDTQVPIEILRQIKARPYSGKAWGAWADTLGTDTINRLSSELRRAVALGETMPDVAKRFRRASRLGKVAATRLARTAVSDVGNRAMQDSIRAIGGDLVAGWLYTATLDSRTSSICQGLDGQRFRRDDPDIPRPPRHPNCRSVLVPLLDLNERLPGERASAGGPVKASVDYGTWLRRQPSEFQRDVLGPIRFRAFRNGVPLADMATNSRPLTVAELRARYPDSVSADA